ncbi:alpha-E domain-containing protein [Deinococcus sp.]|uniref:alpha-E domain-containing protein n=1 Tax=Deinococcus sp. TaxID=47478 RepID=UPI0025C249FF|nr:alpha-E domain-containing protein [Deinococcus sp.]
MLLLSRLAENLYWIGRYMERAENTARLLNVNYYASLESAGRVDEHWRPLLALTGGEGPLLERYGQLDTRSATAWLAFDLENPSSIASSLARARHNARGLRDRIPSEMWETVNRSYLNLCFETGDVMDRDGLYEYCVAAREAAQFFFGIAFATLPRDEGWSFLRSGQLLERADNTVRVLQARLDSPQDPAAMGGPADPTARALQEQQWVSVLKGASAFEAYRKAAHSGIDPRGVAGFLLFDEYFPRSLRYSAENLYDALAQIDHHHPGAHPDILRLSRWLVARLQYARIDDILEQRSPSLPELLIEINRVGAAIDTAYFQQE